MLLFIVLVLRVQFAVICILWRYFWKLVQIYIIVSSHNVNVINVYQRYM